MKRSSFEFNTNVEKMRRITNSLEQEGDTEQLRYIRDGLYHMGGYHHPQIPMPSKRGLLTAAKVLEKKAIEVQKTLQKKAKERLEKERLEKERLEKEKDEIINSLIKKYLIDKSQTYKKLLDPDKLICNNLLKVILTTNINENIKANGRKSVFTLNNDNIDGVFENQIKYYLSEINGTPTAMGNLTDLFNKIKINANQILFIDVLKELLNIIEEKKKEEADRKRIKKEQKKQQ